MTSPPPPREKKRICAQGILFNAKIFLKDYDILSVLVFLSPKMCTRGYLRMISLSKREDDRKISKIFPTIYHQTMVFVHRV